MDYLMVGIIWGAVGGLVGAVIGALYIIKRHAEQKARAASAERMLHPLCTGFRSNGLYPYQGQYPARRSLQPCAAQLFAGISAVMPQNRNSPIYTG